MQSTFLNPDNQAASSDLFLECVSKVLTRGKRGSLERVLGLHKHPEVQLAVMEGNHKHKEQVLQQVVYHAHPSQMCAAQPPVQFADDHYPGGSGGTTGVAPGASSDPAPTADTAALTDGHCLGGPAGAAPGASSDPAPTADTAAEATAPDPAAGAPMAVDESTADGPRPDLGGGHEIVPFEHAATLNDNAMLNRYAREYALARVFTAGRIPAFCMAGRG